MKQREVVKEVELDKRRFCVTLRDALHPETCSILPGSHMAVSVNWGGPILGSLYRDLIILGQYAGPPLIFGNSRMCHSQNSVSGGHVGVIFGCSITYPSWESFPQGSRYMNEPALMPALELLGGSGFVLQSTLQGLWGHFQEGHRILYRDCRKVLPACVTSFPWGSK